MDLGELLALFDRERRRDPPALGAYSVEKGQNLSRVVVGSKSVILWSHIAPSDLESVVASEVSWARSHARTLVWKLYSHDSQLELAQELARRGFHRETHETLLFLDLAADLDIGPETPGVSIEEVLDDTRYQEYVAIDRAAFGGGPVVAHSPAKAPPLDPRVGLFIACVDGTAASVGRVELQQGQRLAGLFGGGTLPALRGRGIYRQLLRSRIKWARARGATAVFTEAVDTTSRPILERIGFVAAAGIDPWTWRGGEVDGIDRDEA